MVARVEDGTVGERLTNVARYLGTTGVTDRNARNDRGSASVTVKEAEPAVDLDVTKEALSPTVTAGGVATFLITVTNQGSANATGVEVEDAIPSGLSFYEDVPSQGSYDSRAGVWQVGTLGPGASATLELMTFVDSGTEGLTITNRAAVRAVDQPDADASNDAGSASVTVDGQVQPISYTTAGNTQLAAGGFPAPGTPTVVDAANIFDPTPPLTAVNAGTFFSENGGTVTLNADGSFLYTPPVGFTGANDDFIVDAGAGGLATVTIQVVNEIVWYVDNRDLSDTGGTGLSDDPFATLDGAEASSGLGAYIFVHYGDGTTNGLNDRIRLKRGQHLGEAAGLTVPGVPGTIAAPSGLRPHITEGNENFATVELEEDTKVVGFDLSHTFGLNPVISAEDFDLGATVIDNVSLLAGSPAGIEVLIATGSIDLTNIDIDVIGEGFRVAGGDPDVTYDGSITSRDLSAISVSNTTGGAIDFLTGPFTATAASSAIFASQVSGSLSIDNVSLPGGPGGVQILDSDGTFTFTNLDIDNVTAVAFDVDGGAPSVSVNVSPTTITNSQDQVVRIRNTTGGIVDFTGGPISDTGGGGIDVFNNAGTISFQNSVTITNPDSAYASAGVNLNSVSGAVSFTDLNVTTSFLDGFVATNGNGLLTVTSGTVDVTNGEAIVIDTHPLAVSFDAISSTNTFGHGIDSSGSSGTFTGAAGSVTNTTGGGVRFNANSGLDFTYGGSIDNTTGYSIEATNNGSSSSFTFDGTVTDVGDGISLTNNASSSFTFNGNIDSQTYDTRGLSATASNVNVLGATNTFSSANSYGIWLDNLEGTNAISNATVIGGISDNLHVAQSQGSAVLDISNSSFDNNPSGNGLDITTFGTGDLTVTIQSSTMSGNSSRGLDASGNNTSTLDVTLSALNALNNNDVGVYINKRGDAAVTFDVDNNSIIGSSSTGVVAEFFDTAVGGLEGYIRNNTIDGGADGILTRGNGDAVGTIEVTGNTLTNQSSNGLDGRTGLTPGDLADLSLTARSNSIEVEYYGMGIFVEAREDGTVCTNIGGPTVPDQNVFTGVGFGSAIYIGQYDNGTFRTERLGGGRTSFQLRYRCSISRTIPSWPGCSSTS